MIEQPAGEPGSEPVTPDSPAVVEVRRRARAGARPATIDCAGCGTPVPVKLRGPLPIWCSSTCRHRAWERRRAATDLAHQAQLHDPNRPAVVLREVVEVPVALVPERSEWVGMLAELTRQIAAHELPDGCLAPTYEALTVAINQAAHRDHQNRSGRIHGFTPHPPLPGRDDVIDAQLDTHTPDTAPARARQAAAIARSYHRRDTRMRARFGER